MAALCTHPAQSLLTGDGDVLGEGTTLFSGRTEAFDSRAAPSTLSVSPVISRMVPALPLTPCMPPGADVVDPHHGARTGKGQKPRQSWGSLVWESRRGQSQNVAQRVQSEEMRSSMAGQDLMGNLHNCIKWQPAF